MTAWIEGLAVVRIGPYHVASLLNIKRNEATPTTWIDPLSALQTHPGIDKCPRPRKAPSRQRARLRRISDFIH